MLGFDFLISLGLGNAKALQSQFESLDAKRAYVDQALFFEKRYQREARSYVSLRDQSDLRQAQLRRAFCEAELFRIQARCCRSVGLDHLAADLEKTAETWVRDEANS